MKNFIRLSLSFVLLICFAGCNISIEEEHLLPKPTCSVDSSSITISITKKSSDTEYINIYRQDTTNTNNEIINIGLIYPKNDPRAGESYIFKDSLIYTGHKYKYYARYCNNGEYKKTEWSDEIQATGGYTDERLKYAASSASLTLETTDYTLKINGTISAPQITNISSYSPVIVLKTANRTSAFEIPSTNTNQIISLRGLLPPEFIGKPVTIIGICAQQKELSTATEPKITHIHWTEAAEIRLEDHSDKTFTIPSLDGANGFDYSKNKD